LTNDLEAPRRDCRFQNRPVSLILFRISERESLDGFVERTRLSNLSAKQCGIARFRHRMGQRVGTGNRVFAGIFNVESSEVECALHVAQLPNIEIVACMAHLGPTDAEAFATAAVVSSETADQSRFDLRKTRRGSRVQAAKAFVLVVCVNRVQ
jgi:hypothetical protein